MPFPIDNRGEMIWQRRINAELEGDRDTFLKAMVEQLKAEKATSILVTGNRITFKGGLFRFVSGWNILTSVSSGYIEALPTRGGLFVTYYLSFRQLLIVATALGFVFMGDLLREKSLPIIAKIGIPIVTLLFLFGMNFLMTVIRFPSFIERALQRSLVARG